MIYVPVYFAFNLLQQYSIMLLAVHTTVQVKRVKKQKEKEKKLASWKIPSLILRILKQCFSVLDFLRKG